MDIVLTGSVAFDCLMTFPGLFREQILPDKLDTLSVSFLVDTMARHRGGIAGNIAYSLGLLGEHPRLMAGVGSDFAEYRKALENVGVDTAWAREFPDCYTGSFFVTTDQANCQIATFYPGAMARAAELRLADVQPKPDLVVISPDDPAAMRGHARECKALGLTLLYDPSQQVARMDGEAIAEGIDACRILICNEYEYSLICKKTGRTADRIESQTPVVIVTLGEKGSQITTEGRRIEIPVAPPAKIADPTGVGDAYRGGLLKGYAHGASWEIAGRLGAVAAAYCLEVVGTQSQQYSRAEFLARYEKTFGKEPLVETIMA